MTIDLNTFGSLVAFGLAVLKVLEFFRDRKPKLKLEAMLRNHVELGNDLLLINSSKVPACVYYYELIWLKPRRITRWFGLYRKEVGYEFTLEDNLADLKIDGYSTATLNFSGIDHFVWGRGAADDLYLKISMVGRKKPLWFWVTGPSKH